MAFTENLDEPRTLSLNSCLCGVAKGEFEPHISREESRYVTRLCLNKKRENGITCQDPDKELFLDEIDGLDFLTVQIRQGSGIILPGMIPIAHRKFFDTEIPPESIPLIGVSLKDVLMSDLRNYAGELHPPTDLHLKRDILQKRIFEGKEVILFMAGQDTLIEALWYEREEIDLFQVLASMGFTAITGANFSVFEGECGFQQQSCQKKSLKFIELATKHGMRVIPHFYALHDGHAGRAVEWLRNNVSIDTITINCQLQRRSEADMKKVRWFAKYIFENLGRDIHIIFQGAGARQLMNLSDHQQYVHVASAGPFYQQLFPKMGQRSGMILPLISHSSSVLSK